jgi:hypothetical protein
MTYQEAMDLIEEHTDYGGSVDRHALAVAISTQGDAPLEFAEYEAFNEAGRQVDEQMKGFRALIVAPTTGSAPTEEEQLNMPMGTQGADARPMAIYQMRSDGDFWHDINKSRFDVLPQAMRRIVYGIGEAK